jgi:hypothetical protein
MTPFNIQLSREIHDERIREASRHRLLTEVVGPQPERLKQVPSLLGRVLSFFDKKRGTASQARAAISSPATRGRAKA